MRNPQEKIVGEWYRFWAFSSRQKKGKRLILDGILQYFLTWRFYHKIDLSNAIVANPDIEPADLMGGFQ